MARHIFFNPTASILEVVEYPHGFDGPRKWRIRRIKNPIHAALLRQAVRMGIILEEEPF